MFFIAEEQNSALERTDPPVWDEYAYVRWLIEVKKSDFDNHESIDIQWNSASLWEKVEKCNPGSARLFKWDIVDDIGFQCHPYTTGWGMIPVNMILYRVLMQSAQHEKLKVYFWLNEAILSIV